MIEQVEWKQGHINVYANGVIIHGRFGEMLTVANDSLTDLIFTLANIEQEKTLTGENNA